MEHRMGNDNAQLSGKEDKTPVVKCSVINCFYNKAQECQAAGIEVTTDHPWPTATTSVATACQTFRPLDEDIWHPDTV